MIPLIPIFLIYLFFDVLFFGLFIKLFQLLICVFGFNTLYLFFTKSISTFILSGLKLSAFIPCSPIYCFFKKYWKIIIINFACLPILEFIGYYFVRWAFYDYVICFFKNIVCWLSCHKCLAKCKCDCHEKHPRPKKPTCHPKVCQNPSETSTECYTSESSIDNDSDSNDSDSDSDISRRSCHKKQNVIERLSNLRKVSNSPIFSKSPIRENTISQTTRSNGITSIPTEDQIKMMMAELKKKK